MTSLTEAKLVALKADLIREDGCLERLCEHGVGHTVGSSRDNDPRLKEPYFWVHGCCAGLDGKPCCSDYLQEEYIEP